jgi:ATP-dependent Clp protease protease subunit
MQMITAPISTFAVGWTASMGTVLLSAGAKGKRYALPHATIHMHSAMGGARGSAPDVQIQLNELMRMQNLLHRILAKHTGQPLERIQHDFERDYFMDARGAVEYGVIDHIVGEPVQPDDGQKQTQGDKDQ